MYDLMFRGGRIVDGTGNPWFYGDVGVSGEKITAVGKLSSEDAEKVIDIKGFVASPGFIDIHAHTDLTLLVKPHLEYKIRQGITTDINGNCGCSPLPTGEAAKKGFSAVASPFFVDVVDQDLDWKTPEEYFEKLERNGIALNVTTFAGHGTLRAVVMPKEKRPANNEELEEMKNILRRCLDAGAYGFSTKLCVPPAIYSDFSEVLELCKVVAEYNGIAAFDSRGLTHDVMKGIEEDILIGERAGIAVQVSHLQLFNENIGKADEVLERIAEARRNGVDVTADVIPMVELNLGGGPAWAALPPKFAKDFQVKLLERFKDRPPAKASEEVSKILDKFWAEKLSDSETYQEVREELLHAEPTLEKNPWKAFKFYEHCTIVRMPARPEWEGKRCPEIAKETGKEIVDVYLELAREAINDALVANWRTTWEDTRKVILHPAVSICTDGVPCEFKEPRTGSAFPFAIRKFVKEEKHLPLEEMVRKMTSLPASKFRLYDRGLIRPEAYADINVFDLDEIRETATRDKPCAPAKGMKFVMINGELVLEDGKMTDALPGRALKLIQRSL